MAKYNKGMVMFGLGMMMVSAWCMKGTEGNVVDDLGSTIHAVRREDPPHEGCGSKHAEGGVEECTGEDDSLGLYADVDDTFRAAIKKAASHLHGDDNDDSPDLAHNNVNFAFTCSQFLLV
ncbi:hypothetical protein CR513_05090, partial [Mucuna pruriens]